MRAAARDDHRRFLNGYYRHVKHVYDATRKYFLFGRDRVLEELLAQPWTSLVEVGPGTGRNLRKLHAARPEARLGGVEASDEMLEMARRRCPAARVVHGFAEDADHAAVLGAPPERILFSYCLSMVQDADAALANARRSLAPGGSVTVIDFGDLRGLPFASAGMGRFLGAFHVASPPPDLLAAHGAAVRWGPGRYYLVATMGPLPRRPGGRA